MAKNPHAVALGRLGGAKGGPARAKALSARRRRAIAGAAGTARALALSASERTALARRAARARWRRPRTPRTAADAPEFVRRLLKTYKPAALRWDNAADRYTVVREILLRGDAAAQRWLKRVHAESEVRELVRRFAGTGCSEPERAQLRALLRLTVRDLPKRPFLKSLWLED